MEQEQQKAGTETAKRNLIEAGFNKTLASAYVDLFYASGEANLKTDPLITASSKNGELYTSIDLKRAENTIYFNGFTGHYKPEIHVMDAVFQLEKNGLQTESSRSLEDKMIRYFKLSDSMGIEPAEVAEARKEMVQVLAMLPGVDPSKGFEVRNQLAVKYLKDTPYQDVFGSYEELAKSYQPQNIQQGYFPYSYNDKYTEKYTVSQAVNMFEGRMVEVYVKPFVTPEKIEQLTKENDPKKLQNLNTFIGLGYILADKVSEKGNVIRGYMDRRIQGVDGKFQEASFNAERKLSGLMIKEMQSQDNRIALLNAMYNGDVAPITYTDIYGKQHNGTAEIRPHKGFPSITIKDEHGLYVRHAQIQSHDLHKAREAMQVIEKMNITPAQIAGADVVPNAAPPAHTQSTDVKIHTDNAPGISPVSQPLNVEANANSAKGATPGKEPGKTGKNAGKGAGKQAKDNGIGI